MNATLIRSLVALAVVGPFFVWSAVRVRRNTRIGAVLQLLGALGLLTVVVAHICESVSLFPRMGWGQAHSAGHYLDLSGAIIGVTLAPVGYALSRRGHEKTATSDG